MNTWRPSGCARSDVMSSTSPGCRRCWSSSIRSRFGWIRLGLSSWRVAIGTRLRCGNRGRSRSNLRDSKADMEGFLHRPIVFREPERTVHPPSWLDYTPFAFWIVDALRPATFVELGCHSGNSYASFAQAVEALELPTICYGVDTWRGDPHAGYFDEMVFDEWSAYHNRRFSSFSQLIRATFDEALEQFSDGSIDLLHIDGYHTFDAVTHDFNAWRPKLSDRGVILCHDIAVRNGDFGAWRLWERLKHECRTFE